MYYTVGQEQKIFNFAIARRSLFYLLNFNSDFQHTNKNKNKKERKKLIFSIYSIQCTVYIILMKNLQQFSPVEYDDFISVRQMEDTR